MMEEAVSERKLSRSVMYAPSLPGAEHMPPGGLADYLATHPCAFETFAPDRVERRRVRRGQPCFLPDQRASRVYFLHGGAVCEFRPSRMATEGLAAFVNPGMVFGLQGLRYGLYERSAEYKLECRALVDADFCAVPGSVAAEGLRTDPTVAETITRSLLNRIQDNQLLLAFAATAEAERRLIAVVWMLATRMGVRGECGMQVNGLSHEDLAMLMSSTRSTVTRLLARLQARDLIVVQRRSMLVPDADALIKLLD